MRCPGDEQCAGQGPGGRVALGADHPASHPTALELADAEESMALDLTAALADDVRVVHIARAVTLSEGSARSQP